MQTTFIPLITGGVVEITQGVKYATPWTAQEAVERLVRMTDEAQELAVEAKLAMAEGHRDPEVLARAAVQRVNEAMSLRDAIGAILVTA